MNIACLFGQNKQECSISFVFRSHNALMMLREPKKKRINTYDLAY